MTKKLLSVATCSLLLFGPLLGLGALEGTDFSGTWKLNPEQSELSRGMRGGGAGRRGRGERRRGGRGGAPSMELSIIQDGSRLTIHQGREDYSLVIGEEAVQIEGPMGLTTVSAQWDEDQLVLNRTIERETPRGNMSIEETQTWSLSADNQTLTQIVQRETARGTQTLKMVFDKQ